MTTDKKTGNDDSKEQKIKQNDPNRDEDAQRQIDDEGKKKESEKNPDDKE
ncbi:hypothetical protein [Sinobaca sp. H24]|nr:hypothetical protein [Sinobaca sp. H24]